MDLFSTKPLENPQRQFIRLFVTCGQKQFIATVDRTQQNLDIQIADAYAQACFENTQIDDMLVHQFQVRNIKQNGYQVVIPRSMQIGHVLDDQSYISCEIIDLKKKVHVKVEQQNIQKNKKKEEKEQKKIIDNLPDVSPPKTGNLTQNEVTKKQPQTQPQKKDKNQSQNQSKQNQSQPNKTNVEEEKPKPQQQQSTQKENVQKILKEVKDNKGVSIEEVPLPQNDLEDKKELSKNEEAIIKKDSVAQVQQPKDVVKENVKEVENNQENQPISLQKEGIKPQQPQKTSQKDQRKTQQGKQQETPQQQHQQPHHQEQLEHEDGNFGTKKVKKNIQNEDQQTNISRELPNAPNTSFQQNVEHTQKQSKIIVKSAVDQVTKQNDQEKQKVQNNQNQQQQKNTKPQQQPQQQQGQQQISNTKLQVKQQQPVKKINKVIATMCDTDEESDDNIPVVKPKATQQQKNVKKNDKKHSIDFDNNLFENC